MIISEIESFVVDIREDLFARSHVEQTVKKCLDKVNKWNEENSECRLTKQYIVDMCLYVATLATPYFKRMQV